MSRVKICLLLFAAALVSILPGCGESGGLSVNPQELYVLPKLPAKYTELNSRITEILNQGAEYAAPTSGSNIQPVQLNDLDGDGREEAIAFFRNTSDEKPLKICVFAADGDSYRLLDQIEGSGTSINSVAYRDMDGNGQKEIAVSWKAAAELQVLEVYSLNPVSGKSLLLRTDYVKYAIADLDGDGKQGVVVLRSDEEGDSVADYYSWQDDGVLTSRSPARVSCTMAELSQLGRVRPGTLRDGAGALFVTGVTDQQMAITDILAMRSGDLSNIVLSVGTGVSGEIAPFCSLYPSDINADGVTEVPRPVALLAPWGEESRLIEWCCYDETGAPAPVLRTFHDLDDGWYLIAPDNWDDSVYISRASRTGEASVTFSLCGASPAESTPFLRISVLTGAGREMRSVRGNRFVLNRQSEAIYTGEFLMDGAACPGGAMTEEQVRDAFNILVLQEWEPGDT